MLKDSNAFMKIKNKISVYRIRLASHE